MGLMFATVREAGNGPIPPRPPLEGVAELDRLCCKSRNLQGHEFFAKTRNGKQSPIRIDAIALSKSPVSLT